MFFVVNNIPASHSHVYHMALRLECSICNNYLEIKYCSMLIIGLRVSAYDIAGVRIAIRAILDMLLHACIKVPLS